MINEEHHLRRQGDYADLPRQLAWLIIGVREIGLPAVVIGALLYIVVFNQNRIDQSLSMVTKGLVTLQDGEERIVENQKIILQRVLR